MLNRLTIINYKAVLDGLATYLPWVRKLFQKGTTGTDKARYCYSVWMRHLVIAFRNGTPQIPESVLEIGPGDSLGIGIAAMLSGVDRYLAIDMVRHANALDNKKIFEELLLLFENRENIPDESEYPEIKPFLDNYSFPNDIFSAKTLEKALHPERVESMRRAIEGKQQENIQLQYFAPWQKNDVIGYNSIDMVISQAVLEHVEDIENIYHLCHSWLKPGGLMSHQVDFRCHGLSRVWNGHWTYPDMLWKIIVGKRSYLINRYPYSTHLKLIQKLRFKIVDERRISSKSTLDRKILAKPYKNLSDVDLTTSGIFIQARKIL